MLLVIMEHNSKIGDGMSFRRNVRINYNWAYLQHQYRIQGGGCLLYFTKRCKDDWIDWH
jgi:hypothetical protein